MKSKQKYPPTHILNPEFRYVPATKTNLAETFARIRAELAARNTEAIPIKTKAKKS